jgi:hypothetical protein
VTRKLILLREIGVSCGNARDNERRNIEAMRDIGPEDIRAGDRHGMREKEFLHTRSMGWLASAEGRNWK